jgi:adhesin/invasin
VSKLSLSILVNSQPANGTSANTVQALVTDDAGAPIAGTVVNFSVNAGTLSQAQASTDANGQAVASVTGTTPGLITLTATLTDGTAASVNTLAFVAVPALVVSPGSLMTTQIKAAESYGKDVEDKAKSDSDESEIDVFAAKLKNILVFVGHDVEAVFEEAVALAKKL